MKRIFTLTIVCLSCMFLTSNVLYAQPVLKGCHLSWGNEKMEPLTEKQEADLQLSAERSDTIDILNYNINLSILDFTNRMVSGFTEITFSPKLDDVNRIKVNLLDFTVDSVYLNGENVPFDRDDIQEFVTVPFAPNFNPGDNVSLIIWYHGAPTVDSGGFGGLDFRDGIAYNLGIGLNSNPYNYGRGWYPCFDNFVERATYDFNITSALPRKAYCSGTFLMETPVSGDIITRSFRLDQEIPSYLAGVAVGNFVEHNTTHDGLDEDIPVQLLANPGNIQNMINSFVDLGGIIDGLEHWFGPYAWNRVGYVTTAIGAMEHSENIAYPTSIAIGGNTPLNRRLMAHELAHHWWGNVAGIPGPSDMWFKEGNAEYSAHLTTEFLFGRTAFLKQVISNHIAVISGAHLDDGDFLPLSGIPFENTYGTHTYNKGASMMHNLRGYLGDENFRTGMTSVQQNLGFASITADDFFAHLTDVTGVPLLDFFENWLKSPGWSGYIVQNMQVNSVTTNDFQLDLDIRQGLRGATVLHDNVPLTLTIYGYEGQTAEASMMASGLITPFSINTTFEPKFVAINEAHFLNLAQSISSISREEAGQYVLGNTGWTVSNTEQDGPVSIWIDQKWFGPEESTDPNVRFNARRYWDVQGYFDNTTDLTGKIQYLGNTSNSFDYNLLSETEDSLILAFRSNGSSEWVEYPDYQKNVFGNPSDGIGNIIINNLRPGHYAFANGELPVSGLKEKVIYNSKLFPNPAADYTKLEVADFPKGSYDLILYGQLGEIIQTQALEHYGGQLNVTIELGDVVNGNYWISLEDKRGEVFVNQAISLIE